MNEPSSFLQGSTDGCTTNSLDNPPYTPRIYLTFLANILIFMFLDVHGDVLYAKTLCPSAQQYLSSHYNLHSMYGYFESQATNQ